MDLDDESHSVCATIWQSMIRRCYGPKEIQKHPTYKDCAVCDEWLVYSNFKRWFEGPENGYRDGYQLDKDIFSDGSKIYSPSTCCFIPHDINKLIIMDNRKNGTLPTGVRKQPHGYQAFLSINGHPAYLGHCKTKDEAFQLYIKNKAKHISNTALEYFNRGEITRRVYDGLLRFSQELTDKINGK